MDIVSAGMHNAGNLGLKRGRSFSSSTGSASMSARNAMHGPVFRLFMTATVLVPEIPSISGTPRAFRGAADANRQCLSP